MYFCKFFHTLSRSVFIFLAVAELTMLFGCLNKEFKFFLRLHVLEMRNKE